jgi:DNA polymerase III alpha subunit
MAAPERAGGATFTPLRVRSHGSLLNGVASPEALIERALALGYHSLALTDRDNLYLAIRFYRAARADGLRPLPGAELTHGGHAALLIPLDRRGWSHLCALLTRRHLDARFDLAAALAELHAGLHVIVESPGLAAALLAAGVPAAAAIAGAGARAEGGRAGGLWMGVRGLPGERRELKARVAAARGFGIPLVATGDCVLLEPRDFDTHRAAVTAAAGELLERMPAAAFCAREAVLAGPAAWARRVRALCASAGEPGAAAEALQHNAALVARCRLEIELGVPIFPRAPLPAGVPGPAHLLAQCREGLERRYGPRHAAAERRLSWELDIIERMGFTDYFLLVAEIVGFARARGIPTVGRGSGASSIVAYALGITNVDPLRHGLTFERFLHPARRDCPDLDIDLCWRRRDEVIAHVYETYGHDRVAMIATHATLGARSAFRETAKALGVANARVNALARMVPREMDPPYRAQLASLPGASHVDWSEPPLAQALTLAERVSGAPRHLSVHCGGIVIADRALTDYVPLERAAKEVVVTQFEMRAIEAIGLVKMDLLGNRALSTIGECIALARAGDEQARGGDEQARGGNEQARGGNEQGRGGNEQARGGNEQARGGNEQARGGETESPERQSKPSRSQGGRERGLRLVRGAHGCAPRTGRSGDSVPPPLAPGTSAVLEGDSVPPPLAPGTSAALDVESIPEDDPATAARVAAGDTLNCFQLESPAMRHLLRMLDARTLEDTIAAVALVRPGAAESGMKEAYCRRRRGLEPPVFAHPRLEPVLGPAYGVMLYEEDVMAVAAAVAGLTLAEGDDLRRAIGAARSDQEFRALEGGFVGQAARAGVEDASARAVWRDLTRFAGYAFCKAHAAGYGTLGWHSAYLKTHFPAPWAVGILNHHAGMYATWVHVEDLRRHGVEFRAPCVMRSDWDARLEQGAVHVGLSCVFGLAEATARRIVAARAERGFESLADFIDRVRPALPEAEALILAGALDRTGRTRPSLLLEARVTDARQRGVRPPARAADASLLPRAVAPLAVPELPEFGLAERVRGECSATGLWFSAHPLDVLADPAALRGATPAASLAQNVGRRVALVGLPCATRRVETKQGGVMLFLTLADRSGLAECVLFPDAYRTLAHVLRGQVVRAAGRVEETLGALTVTVTGASEVSAETLRLSDHPRDGDDHAVARHARC